MTKKQAYLFKVDSPFGKFEIIISESVSGEWSKYGISEKEIRADAVTLARAELGGPAARITSQGEKINKIPLDFNVSKKMKGGFIKKIDMKSNPTQTSSFDWFSKKTKLDLLHFFEEKHPDKDVSEIKEEIEESLNENGRYSSFGNCASVTVDGTEYNLIPSHDEFHEIAIDYVAQMLEDEPELFTQSWLEQHLYITDTDKRLIAGDEAEAYTSNMNDREVSFLYEGEMGELLYRVEPNEEEGEDGVPDYDKMRETIYDLRYDYVYDSLQDDPMDFFVYDLGTYTKEEYLKADFVRINIAEAAEDAVQEDGEAHFLSHYDGNYEETKDGIIVMRED